MVDHDSLYHRLFRHRALVEPLIRDFLPEAMAAGVDLAGLTPMPAKSHGEDGQRREADIVWRLPLVDGRAAYLALQIEFQSRSDPWMAVRCLSYAGLLWERIIAEQGLSATDPLPPVLVTVLYNGPRPWRAPTEIAPLVGLPNASSLWPWQPRLRYHVIDINRLPRDDLAPMDTAFALLARLEQEQGRAELAGLIGAVRDWLQRHRAEAAHLRRLFTDLIRQGLTLQGVPVTIPEDLREIQAMLTNPDQTWEQQWMAKGRAEGHAEGHAEGMAATLILLAEQKFGPLPEERRATIRAADPSTLQTWLARLFATEDLDTLLALDH